MVQTVGILLDKNGTGTYITCVYLHLEWLLKVRSHQNRGTT
jgi:hypothetical protein